MADEPGSPDKAPEPGVADKGPGPAADQRDRTEASAGRTRFGGHRGPLPRHRPPWWPEGEAWPPVGRDGRPAWPRRRHGFWPAIGCLLIGLIAFAVLGASYVGLHILSLLPGALRLGAPSRPLLALVFVVLVLAVIGLVRGFRRLAEPLENLVDAARRVENGAYDTRVSEHVRGPHELRELSRAFNTMTSRLEANEQRRRALLADVGHELRTPLAVIRGNLEA
ncbi:MAG: HAMP domain-containing protein, partial [Candidatus Limnocylindrales bacterium]